MDCPNCRAVSVPTARYCRDCGACLETVGSGDEFDNQVSSDARRRAAGGHDEDRLREVFDLAEMISWDWELNSKKLTISEDFGRFFGLPSTGSTVPDDERMFDPVHSDDRAPLAEAFRTALSTGDELHFEFRGLPKGGECRWYAARGRILETSDGKPTRMIGITQDVTVRKRAEEALRRSKELLEQRVQERTERLQQANLELSGQIAERRSAEEELRRNEARYRAVVEDQTELIARWNFADNITFVNGAVCRYLNLPPDEILGKSFLTYVPVDDLPKLQTHVSTLTSERPIGSIEHRLKLSDGRIRWTQWTNRAFFDELGRLIEFQSVGRDVTERHWAEAALLQSERRFRSLVEDAPVGVWQVGADGDSVQYLNPALRRMLEIPKDANVDAMRISSFVSTGSRAMGAAQLELRRRGTSSSYEMDYVSKSGRIVNALVCGSPIVDSHGRITSLIGMSIDVTEKKAVEAERRLVENELRGAVASLRDSEERYRTLFETCRDAVVVADFSGEICSANSAAAEMHGYSQEELLTLNVRELGDHSGFRTISDRRLRLRAGETAAFELLHRRKDGSTFPVDVVAAPIRLGDKVYALYFYRDITERKRVEERMAELSGELAHVARFSVLGELAAGLAHEINQPLTAIHLYAAAALECAEAEGCLELRSALQGIGEESFRAGEIVRRARAFVRRAPSTRTSHDVNQLIREVLQMMNGDLRSSRTTVEIRLDESLPPLVIDGIQIQQVLVNLVRNAVESMAESDPCSRSLTIVSQRSEGTLRVAVSDSGRGISPTIAEKLFQPFQTTKSTGLGLGLVICRTLIEAHSGNIGWCPGASGTTFFFDLPLDADGSGRPVDGSD